MLIAIGVVITWVFHAFQLMGFIFIPMHIPVLLCGIICGLPYGIACGIIAPVLSHLLTGMPFFAVLPAMLCELPVYGAVAALLMCMIRMKNIYVKIYVSLIGAMLAGRIVFGAVNALIFNFGEYSMKAWLAAAFTTPVPGIIIQLIVIPAIVIALQKAKLIELE